jgi:hypothetical protein
MEKFLDKVFIEPFNGLLEKISVFLPNLLASLVLIIIGLVIAWILKGIIVRATQFLKLDIISERLGVTQVLQKGGIKEPISRLTGRLVYWVVLISFIIMGLNALKVHAVENLLNRFLLYLPNVIAAVIVVVFGYILGNFLGRATLIASVNAGLTIASLLGEFVKFTVFIIATSMALELLGIGKNTVLVAFAIVFGGVVLAISIAFGLGGKEIAKDYIEQRLKEKEEKDNIEHL